MVFIALLLVPQENGRLFVLDNLLGLHPSSLHSFPLAPFLSSDYCPFPIPLVASVTALPMGN